MICMFLIICQSLSLSLSLCSQDRSAFLSFHANTIFNNGDTKKKLQIKLQQTKSSLNKEAVPRLLLLALSLSLFLSPLQTQGGTWILFVFFSSSYCPSGSSPQPPPLWSLFQFMPGLTLGSSPPFMTLFFLLILCPFPKSPRNWKLFLQVFTPCLSLAASLLCFSVVSLSLYYVSRSWVRPFFPNSTANFEIPDAINVGVVQCPVSVTRGVIRALFGCWEIKRKNNKFEH